MTWMYTDCKVNQVVKPRTINKHKMKDIKLPTNFPVYSSFIDTLHIVVEKIYNDCGDSKAWKILVPWNVFSSHSDKTEDIEKNKKDVEGYSLYISLIHTLKNYLTLMQKRDKECFRLKELQKNGYKKPTWQSLQSKIEKDYSDTPNPVWMFNCLGSIDLESIRYSREYTYKDILEGILSWIFLDSKLLEPEVCSRSLKGKLLLDFSDFEAWSPFFWNQASNSLFMEHLPFKTNEKEIYYDFDYHDNTKHAIVEYCEMYGWVKKLKLFGYTRESAREFFGIEGYISKLYYLTYLEHDDETESLFKGFIKGFALPMFDDVWQSLVIDGL